MRRAEYTIIKIVWLAARCEKRGKIMRQQLEQRLEQLKAEFESGQKLLADLDAKRANVREKMLCISGAIQVLDEELAKAANPSQVLAEPPDGRNSGLEKTPVMVQS